MSRGWNDFWKGERNAFTTIMKINTSYFAKKLGDVVRLNDQTNLLDYGCGPGLLLDSLQARSINFTGADINDFYLSQCRLNHPESVFMTISSDVDTTRALLVANIGTKRFDVITLLSILQYFESEHHIEQVLNMLKDYLKPQGKIILADIVTEHTSPIKDAWSLLVESLKQFRIIAFTRFILYLIFSPYRKLSGENKLLTMSDHTIQEISERIGLKCTISPRMTIHSSRTNYVLAIR